MSLQNFTLDLGPFQMIVDEPIWDNVIPSDILDVSVPHTSAMMIGILDALDTAIADGHTIYLHCWGGIGRTGTVVGCWLVRHGMTGDEALSTIAHHWQGVAKRVYHPRSPETDEQHAYVQG